MCMLQRIHYVYTLYQVSFDARHHAVYFGAFVERAGLEKMVDLDWKAYGLRKVLSPMSHWLL